jgi:2-polyprenyl-3-methyl-5-hydroxy-6-metoxy-1,4-benzoquinol methylase
MTQSADTPSPELFLQSVSAYQRTEALRAAVELDLFTAIGEGRSAVAALAKHCGTSEKGMRVLCDYLTLAGFLVKADERYGLTPSTAKFLDRRSPTYMGGMLEFLLSEHIRGGYANLLPAIRKGGTVQSAGGLTDPEHPAWMNFARVMMPMMAPVALRAARLIDLPLDAKLEVLDIAAGHGLYGIEVGKRFPQANVTGLDWPRVLEVAQENAQRAGLGARYRTIRGDAFQVDLGSGYDVVLIPNFLHHFGFDACVGFLRKVNRALKPDGIALTVEFVPNEDRVSPPFPAAFALSMLVLTAEGDAYTFAQLDDMLKQAGFARNALHALEPTAQHAVVSRK